MIFENPLDAAEKFIEILNPAEFEQTILICNSIKNIPFVDYLAHQFELPYDFLFNKGIYTPDKSTQIAKISETRDVVLIDELIECFGISNEYLNSMCKLLYDENITPKINTYREGAPISQLAGANCLVIDQGCNSGLTALLCAKSLLNLGAKSVRYATAVIAKDAAEFLSGYFDKLYYLQAIEHFVNKDYYYEQSLDITQSQALEILKDSAFYLPFLKEKYDN